MSKPFDHQIYKGFQALIHPKPIASTRERRLGISAWFKTLLSLPKPPSPMTSTESLWKRHRELLAPSTL
ncbi:MAG: hypothetical protein SFU25_08885 [Candidatus Caenarcaniphilales bacterium]|nr:hypothetical protein [Candidatus Caenarcaniphilales bacterium]